MNIFIYLCPEITEAAASRSSATKACVLDSELKLRHWLRAGSRGHRACRGVVAAQALRLRPEACLVVGPATRREWQQARRAVWDFFRKGIEKQERTVIDFPFGSALFSTQSPLISDYAVIVGLINVRS